MISIKSHQSRRTHHESDGFSSDDTAYPRYVNYWDSVRDTILCNLDTGDDTDSPFTSNARCGQFRQLAYDAIREDTGLPFEDYGDDVERWLAWLKADDTKDARDIALRRRLGTEYWRQKYGDTDIA